MFSAHIVFCDINNHSTLNFEERVQILDKYWDICEKYKPKDLNKYSFYETDNDSFMAGFSDQVGFFSGYDILNLIGMLVNDFSKINISVSFGINLMACRQPLEWVKLPGFVNNNEFLHMPDKVFDKIGKIQRSKLAGDALIITSRLQSLAKKLGVLGCVSIFQDGHINDLNSYKLKNGKKIKAKIVSYDDCQKLGREHCDWLLERKIKAYSIELL